MKLFIYGIITGVLAASFSAWAPTIENATPADYAKTALTRP